MTGCLNFRDVSQDIINYMTCVFLQLNLSLSGSCLWLMVGDILDQVLSFKVIIHPKLIFHQFSAHHFLHVGSGDIFVYDIFYPHSGVL